MRVCVVDDCANPARGKTVPWCEAHYQRMRRRGTTDLGKRGYKPRPEEERFWEKVVQHDNDQCWGWLAAPDRHGYGVFTLANGKSVKAHRYAYELLVGPIPDGLGLDHLCHNRDESCPGGPSCTHRRCVFPSHMEPATTLVNSRRGRAGLPNKSKTHCPQGHKYEGENLYVEPSTGRRRCLVCKRATSERYERRRRAAR